MVAPAHGRKHARQGDLGVGAAGRHLGKIDHRQLGQFRRGLVAVAVQPPVGSARGFSHHQHQHQRLGACDHAAACLGVQTDGQTGLCRAFGAGSQHRPCGPDVVGGCHQVAHFLVVAHQRRKRLKHQQQGAHQHQHGQDQRTQPGGTGAPPGSLHQAHAPQHHQRQHGVKQQVEQQAPGQQFTRLMNVAAQDVAHHRRVQVDAKALHEVAGQSRAHDQHRQQRLHRPAVGKRRQQHKVQGSQHHHQRHAKPPGAGFREAAVLERGRHKQVVGSQGPEQTGGQQQLLHRGLDAKRRQEAAW